MLDQTLLQGHDFCSSAMPIAFRMVGGRDMTDFSFRGELEQMCHLDWQEGEVHWAGIRLRRAFEPGSPIR